MRCSKAKKLMFSYLDDKLSKDEKEEVTAHLKECPWCASEYKKTSKMLKVLNGTEPKMVPEGLHSDIMREINGLRAFKEDEKREVSRALRKGIVRGGLVCVACFLAFFIIQFVDFDSLKTEGVGSILKIDQKIQEEKMMNTRNAAGDAIYDTKEAAEAEEASIPYEVFDTSADMSVDEEVKKIASTTAEKEDNLGLLGTESYSTVLDDAAISKKAAVNMYVTNYNDSVNKLEVLLGETGGEVYYKNVFYDIDEEGKTSDYKTAVIAVKVPESKFTDLYDKVSGLGTSDVEIMQDAEADVDISLDDQLLEAKNQKTELVGQIETLREENEDHKNDDDIEALKVRVSDIEDQIEDLEEEIENPEDNASDKICKLEITFKEISESELKGILSGSTW
ncbi:MAG: zf-HC2 domain-containing protein [Clostridia bacterium]|nr:zf-HC2 domain-containing protein [Clostridia bacterium]